MRDLVDVYRRLAARCDYPLHLGLTKAGMGIEGIVVNRQPGLLPERRHRQHRCRILTPPGSSSLGSVKVARQVLQ